MFKKVMIIENEYGEEMFELERKDTRLGMFWAIKDEDMLEWRAMAFEDGDVFKVKMIEREV